jgi:hypothetical protein
MIRLFPPSGDFIYSYHSPIKEWPKWAYWHCNTALVSPWTGHTWGLIDRGQKVYIPVLRAALGELPYLDEVPGSLAFYEETISELPRELLERELTVMYDFTSTTESVSICSTLSESAMSQSLMQKIVEARVKIAAGEMTDEALRDLLKEMRQDRGSAAIASAKSRAKKTEVDPEDALKAFLS